MSQARVAKQLVEDQGINLASAIDFNVNERVITLTLEEIIESYMQASLESQEVFLLALQKAATSKEGVKEFFESMGQLLLMSQLSDKFA